MRHSHRRLLAIRGPALALLSITAVVMLVTWPQATLLTTHVGGHIDALFSVWRLSWIADSVASPHARVFDAPIFHPHRDTLAYSDAILLSGLLTAPFRWLGATPVTVYNVYLLSVFVASGFTAALLCQRLSGSWLAGIVGGVIFTAAPHRMEHFERLELVTSAAIPLAFYCWHVGSAQGSRRWFAAACVCVAIQWYLGMYHAVFLATVMPCLAIDWWTTDPRTKRRAIAGAATGTLLAALLIAPSLGPYFRARQEVGGRSASEVAAYSAELRNFVAVHPRNWLYGDHLSRYGAPERYFFPGSIALVLAVAGALVAPRKLAILYGATLVIAVEITLGNNGLLFPVLRDLGAPYNSLRSPARAGVVVLLPIAVLASLGAARLLGQMKRQTAALVTVALLAVLVVEYRMRPLLWNLAPSDALPWMPPANAVLLEYPLAPPGRFDLNIDAHYMVGRIGAWPKMLNGYSGHHPRDYMQLLEDMADFPSERALAAMAARGVTHIALHEGWMVDRYRPLVGTLITTPRLELVGGYDERDGEVAVFRVGSTRTR
jgi:hypothetical protein